MANKLIKSSPNYELKEFGNYNVWDLNEFWLVDWKPVRPDATFEGWVPDAFGINSVKSVNLSVATPIELY